MSDIFGQFAGAASDIFGGIASEKQAKGYTAAAGYAFQNVDLTKQSTAIQAMQAQREIYKTLGGARSDIAGAGLAQSGSAIDILRSSASQGALTQQLIKVQGAIDANAYQAEGENYVAMATAAKTAGKGSKVSGFLKAAGTVAAIFAFSDERMKTGVTLRYRRADGLGIYHFRYLGDPSGQTFEGVMAHEVQEKYPSAVHERVDGTLTVDYEAIGVIPRVIEEAA